MPWGKCKRTAGAVRGFMQVNSHEFKNRRGGMNWEIGMDIYTLLCTKEVTNKNLLYNTENSTQGSVVT